jgi:hypothetical protein
MVNQSSPKDRKRKAHAAPNLSKKTKVEKVPLETIVKEEVYDHEEFNDLLLNGADVILKEGYANSEERNYVNISNKSGTEKKYPCSQCDKDFSSRQAMQRHELIHSDNPTPFACDHCEKKFDRKYRLEKHKKTAHNDFPEAEAYLGDDTTEDQHTLEETQEAVEEVAIPDNVLENVELDENAIQGDEGMELDEHDEAPAEKEDDDGINEAPDVSDPMVKEKLLSDRKKLLAELNSIEGQGDLDFLNLG